MKAKNLKRIFSIVLSIVMITSILPYGNIIAFSADTIKGSVETVPVTSSSALSREQNINQDWKFNMTSADCYAKLYNDSSWSSVDLPHDFSITQSFSSSNEAESGFLPGGTGWYRKKIVVPANMAGKKFELNFDGSYMHTYVYVNESYVGENHYGYNSFAFDITDQLVCDGTTENVIAVKVVHNTPSSRWYSGSGIYRDVTLITTDSIHIAHNGLTITTPNIESGNGHVNVVAKVKNDSSSNSSVSVKATIYEKNSNTPVATASNNATVNAGNTSNVTITPSVSNPKLWSTDTPNLYVAKIEVSNNGNVVDTYEDTFGFRYFTWNRATGFSLNGNKLKLQGVCMHHDQGALGSAAYYDAMYRQMEKMKNMGVNAIRATHNPYSKEFYKICDELGLLVIEELFDGWQLAKNGNSNDFSSQWTKTIESNNSIIGGNSSMTWPEFVVREICQRDINRPSVFMWSLGNEIFEGTNESMYFTGVASNLISWVSSADPSRKLTIGDNNIKNNATRYTDVDKLIANAGGIIGLNYCDYTNKNTDHYYSIYNNSNYANFVLYGSETSSSTNSRDRYTSQSSNSDIDGKGHLTSFDTSSVGWGMNAHDSMFNTIAHDYIAGEFIWTGWDYIGEPTPWNGVNAGRVYYNVVSGAPNSSYFGIVDTAGFEKDPYYLYRSQWGDSLEKTTTHLVTAWDSDNYMLTNSKVPVFLFSNAYKVEIYRNGTLMGTATRTDKTTSAGFKYHIYDTASNNSDCSNVAFQNNSTSFYAEFDIAYQAGTLSTKSYDKNGNLIDSSNIEGRYTVSTPGSVSKAVIYKDKEEITANGASLAYFSVDLTDVNGNRDTTATNQITFNLTGNGEIMGVDNGDQATINKFQQSSVINPNNRTTATINAYGGKALVIVRSTKNAGQITVTASSSSSEFTSATASVRTVAEEGGVLVDGDITDYSLIRNYSVMVGVRPTFDTTATAHIMGSDDVINGTITWSSVGSDVYGTAGNYTINGTANFSGYAPIPVTCVLHVIDSVSTARNISAVTIPNKIPTLPDTVMGLNSNGDDCGELSVEWEELTASKFEIKNTIVEVNGQAKYFKTNTVPVKAFVRVAPAIVSTDSSISTTATVTSDMAGSIANLTDGNKSTYALTNQGKRTQKDTAYVQYTWATAVTLSSIDITYLIDSPSAEPEDIDIQYSLNGTEYTSIGYVGPAEELVSGQTYNYKLDKTINPISVKVVFTQQLRTSGQKCITLSEMKLNSTTETVPAANAGVNLTDISVNGVTINGFSTDVDSYPNVVLSDDDVITATSDNNTAITILPIVNGGAKIITISEDGSETITYNIGKSKNVAPAPVANTYTFDASNANITEYTGLDGWTNLRTITDSSNNSKFDAVKWTGVTSENGYIKFDNSLASTGKTSDSVINEINGDAWSIQLDYKYTGSNSSLLFGIGTPERVTASNPGSNNDRLGQTTYCANLVRIHADGKIYIADSTSIAKTISVTSSSDTSIKIEYIKGNLKIYLADSAVYETTVDESLFSKGVGNYFFGATAENYGGGTLRYYKTASNALDNFYIKKIFATTISTQENVETVDGWQVVQTDNFANSQYTSTGSGAWTNINTTFSSPAGWGTHIWFSGNYSNNSSMLTTDSVGTKISDGFIFTTGSTTPVSNLNEFRIDLSFNTNADRFNSGYGNIPFFALSNDTDSVGYDSSSYPTASNSKSVLAIGFGGEVYTGTTKIGNISTTPSSFEANTEYYFSIQYKDSKVKIDVTKVSTNETTSNEFEATITPSNIKRIYIGNAGKDRFPKNIRYHYVKFYEPQTAPVNPVEPVEPTIDVTQIDSAMRAFETKVSSGKIYNNIYNAYHAYTECQKARDAAYYGKDTSINLAEKASALVTATNALTEWSMSMPTATSKVSARFSSNDNAELNKQYFKSALFIENNDDAIIEEIKPNHCWFGMYLHNGTYIYDGQNPIEVPVMLDLSPYSGYNSLRLFSAFLTNQNSAVSLKGRWYGSDGNGSNRKYYYYHDAASLQSNSSDYYSRAFSFPSVYPYNNNSAYNDAKIGNLSGKAKWSLYSTNTFVINGATLFASSPNAVSTNASLGTLNIHAYNSDSLSSPWINTSNISRTIKVINYKGIKDRADTYANKFRNITNYKENGLNWGADALNRFTALNYNIDSLSASSLTSDMTTAHSSFTSADSFTKSDSANYAALRTALNNASVTVNDNCYNADDFTAYINARNSAIKAMKNVGANGYVESFDNKSIATYASELSNAINALNNSDGDHQYLVGQYNSSTKQIVYSCSRNDAHNKIIVDVSSLIASLDELESELSNEDKYKEQSIKNVRYYINSNHLNNLINNDNTVSNVYNQIQIDNFATMISTMKSSLENRINIKRFDIDYAYVKDNNVLKRGILLDARYGDWVTNSNYTLQENETVYKWTIEDAQTGIQKLTTNASTNYNIYIHNQMSLICYITDGTEITPDGYNKITLKNKQGRIAGLEYCDKNEVFTVDANSILDSNGNTLFTVDKPPYYQITGFLVGGKTYVSGETFSVTKDSLIMPVYTAQTQYKIYTTGDYAGSVLVNGSLEHSGNINNAYSANWDEKIECVYNSGGSKAIYWYANGILVHYGDKYTFRACSDVVITGSQYSNVDVITSYVSHFNYDADNNRVTAVVDFYVPDGRAEEAGVILSTAYSTKEDIIANGKKFSSKRFTESNNQAKITVSRTGMYSFDMYAVPYVIVNGTTYYGNPATPIHFELS